MRLSKYIKHLHPDHHEEFREELKLVEGEVITPERQIQLQEDAQIAFESICERYGYPGASDDDEEEQSI